MVRNLDLFVAFSEYLRGENTTDFPILLNRWCRSHPDLVAGLPIWGNLPAPPPDTISPWYKTEDEAIVAGWLSMLDKGQYGMLIFGPGGMGETGLLAATPFAKGNVISPIEPIEPPPESGAHIGPEFPGGPVVPPGERDPVGKLPPPESLPIGLRLEELVGSRQDFQLTVDGRMVLDSEIDGNGIVHFNIDTVGSSVKGYEAFDLMIKTLRSQRERNLRNLGQQEYRAIK